MTAPSPSLNTGNAVSVSLKVDHATVDAEQLASIEVVSAANRISRGRIVVVLGWADDGTLAFGSVERFALGKSVELGAGYGSPETVIHDGVITSLSLDISPNGPARLVIESAGTEAASNGIGPRHRRRYYCSNTAIRSNRWACGSRRRFGAIASKCAGGCGFKATRWQSRALV